MASRKSKQPRPTTRARKVALAIRSIKKFHKIGLKLPPPASPSEEYGRGTIDAAAEKVGLNPDTVRKSRQFASKEDGYSEEDLKRLCDEIETHQSKPEPELKLKDPVFGRSHVIRLISVPKKERTSIQREAIEQVWSLQELEEEIAKRFGRRRAGGRPHRIPENFEGILVQLEGMCEHWRRWERAIAGNEQAGADSVNGTLKSLIEKATCHVAALHEFVKKKQTRLRALADRKSGRKN